MTEQETQMQMYIQALPAVLGQWFAWHSPIYFGDAKLEHHGSEAAGHIREFIASYTDEAIRQSNKRGNNV